MEEISRLRILLHVYLCLFLLHSSSSSSSDAFSMVDGRRPPALMKMILDMVTPLDGPNTQPYVASPSTIPPYDSLSPMPLPQNAPPFCLYPPSTPSAGTSSPPQSGGGGGGFSPIPPEYTPPSTGSPIPPEYTPPSASGGGSAGGFNPSPPEYNPPSPSTASSGGGSTGGFNPNPPEYNPPSPSAGSGGSTGGFNPSPPASGGGGGGFNPSPPISGGGGGGGAGGGFNPSPPSPSGGSGGGGPRSPVFLPPIVYPAPAVPPPPYTGPKQALWCVVKPSVPDPIIMEALNYACASGAECSEILDGGACFQPNTVAAHASYAFNSYWQRTKVAGGSCGFGGIAIIVSVDPSYDTCHFIYV